MKNLPISSEKYIEEGVYVGDLFEFVDSDEQPHLFQNIELIKQYAKDNIEHIRCRYQYFPTKDINYEDSISYADVEKRNKFVEENNLKIWQRWYEFAGPNNMNQYFRKIGIDIVNKMYPTHNFKLNDFKNNGNFTMYLDGDMIQPHMDGLNEGRICGLIMYLSSENEYNDGGGELTIVTNSNKEYVVKPVLGNFSLLEFMNSNIRHGVNPVKNGFVRFAYTIFFELNKNI
jgi:Rps23 Pro-64 3,4-dihydroxylase Tpa1-like proline 4-hydroxylase